MGMSSDLPVRRRDEEMELHDVVPASCGSCTCEHVVARDDHEIVWEPGRAWGEGCSDRACHCHVDPVIGRRRHRDSVNPLDG
jgi:hypothetical protein